MGNADGIVIIEKERADQVYEAALRRREREAELMEQLRRGKTTLELLGLPRMEQLKGRKVNARPDAQSAGPSGG